MLPPLDISLSNTKKNLACGEAIATLIAVDEGARCAHPGPRGDEGAQEKSFRLWIWAVGRENDLKKLKIQAEWNEKRSS